MKATQNTKLLIYSLSLILIIILDKSFHEILHEEGVSLIKHLQASPAAINFFEIFAFLGSKIMKLYIFIFIFCFCNLYHAFLYVLITYFSFFLTSTMKILYKDTRPFLEYQEIKALDCETGYGYPSNHVLTSIPAFLIFFDIVFQRFKFYEFKNAKLINFFGHFVLMVFFILLAISRMVIGVHYLHQVLFGFILGYLTYFFFTDYLGCNLDEEAKALFIEVLFDKAKMRKCVYLLILVYFNFLFIYAFINKDPNEQTLTDNFIRKCGQRPKFTPLQKSFVGSAEYFAIFGGIVGIYIDAVFHDLNSHKEFIFENISNSKKNVVGNWNDTCLHISFFRFFFGFLLGYFYMLFFTSIPSFPQSLVYSYIFTGFLTLFLSMVFFFGFSKRIFKILKLSNNERSNKSSCELEESLLDI